MNCPSCNSRNIVRNGSIHNGKKKFQCNCCGRQFVGNPENRTISREIKELIDKLLLEKLPLAGIARATGVSERWLQNYVNEKYKNIPKNLNIKKKSECRLTIECDEECSFVMNKKNKQWIWLAKDRDSREIVGYYIGSRDKTGAAGLWNSLPAVYRQCAVCYTDFWAAYDEILPYKRHFPVGKGSGQTNHIERFNNTLRQRVACLVRKTLSFSKKTENFIGAILNFIHYYNASLINI